MSPATVVVSGLGRCGTSMVMQMLHSCGLSCAGEYPAFEPYETNLLVNRLKASWCQQFDAIKILDPHRGRIPNFPFKVIWLDRDVVQQSVSQVKFAVMVAGVPYTEGACGRIARSLQDEREMARTQYAGREILTLDFECAVDRPIYFCRAIANFLPERNLEAERMASVVRYRPSGVLCAMDLAMEAELSEAR